MDGGVLERACRTVKYHSTALRKCKIEHAPMCRSDWTVIDWTRVSLMTVILARLFFTASRCTSMQTSPGVV